MNPTLWSEYTSKNGHGNSSGDWWHNDVIVLLTLLNDVLENGWFYDMCIFLSQLKTKQQKEFLCHLARVCNTASGHLVRHHGRITMSREGEEEEHAPCV